MVYEKIRLKKMVEYIPKNKSITVLDVGCGNQYMKEFMPKNATYYGLDVRGADITLDIEKETLDKKFEVVMFSELMEHIGDVDTFLKKLKSMTKEGGLMIGSVPNPNTITENIIYWTGILKPDLTRTHTHVSMFREQELAQRFHRLNFKYKLRGTDFAFPILDRIFPEKFAAWLGDKLPRMSRHTIFVLK